MENFFKNIDIKQDIKCFGKPPFDNFNKRNNNKILERKKSKLVLQICENPYNGKRLQGDLKGIITLGFFHRRTEYRIAFMSEPIIKEKLKNQIQTKGHIHNGGGSRRFYNRRRAYVNSSNFDL